MNLNYFLYMAEAEGVESVTSTKQTHIEAAIKDFIAAARRGLDINNDTVQTTIFENHKIFNITKAEREYIRKKVEKAFYR